MSNMEKAAQMIRDLSEVDGETLGYAHVHNIAQALADAGLLAPDLPEPDKTGILVQDARWWLLGGPDDPSVWAAPDSPVMVQRIEPGELTPDEAREVAHALLAAADYSEGNQE